MIDLANRVALVPGGSGGIGSVVAEVLAECGADIVLGYHGNRTRAEQVAATARNAGRRARLDRIDATDAADLERWVGETLSEFGRIDILVNCLGIHQPFLPFKDQSPDNWPMTVAIEFMACVHVYHKVIGPMIDRGSGRIITVGSDSGKVGTTGEAVSAGCRGGVNAFSKTLARELARTGITVNTVCPGPIDTPAMNRRLEAEGVSGRIAAGLVGAVPMRRMGDPRDVANMVAFLASDEAGYVTGQTISVSGGLTMC